MIGKVSRYIARRFYSINIFRGKKNPNPIKWGIIGLGNMADKYAFVINNQRDSIVYSVASRSLEKAKQFAKRHGKCKAYGSYDEMIYDSSNVVNVIYIATPAKYHYENIKKCLLAGKNVVSEKPITTSFEQLQELIKIAKQNDCFLMEGMWTKCLPTFRKAAYWINKGKIGKMKLIKVDFYKREIVMPELAVYNPKEGGGVLLDYGVYAISFMTYFLKGYPTSLKYYNHISPLGIDTDWLIYANKSDVEAFVNISSGFSSLSKASITGNLGSIEWDSQFNRTNKIALFDSLGKKVEEYNVKYRFEGFEYIVEEVNRCVKEKKMESLLVPLNETLDTIKVIDNLMGKQTG